MPADNAKNSKVVLRLCAACEGGDLSAGKAALKAALTSAGLEQSVSVRPAQCLGTCAKPTALALQGVGRATYVFSELDWIRDAEDIAATCALYLEVPKGWIEDARACGRLRHCLQARVPALDP